MKRLLLLSFATIGVLCSALAQDRILWSDQSSGLNPDKIGSVKAADLTDATTISSLSNAENPSGVAYYHANPTYPMFYVKSSAVVRDQMNGTRNDFITMSGLGRGVAIDYIGKKIYWANQTSGYIGRANLDGTDKDESYLTGLNNPYDLEIDPVNQKIYWSENAADGDISRANLSDGSNKEALIENVFAEGVAVDPLRGKLYFSDYTNGVQSANLDGSGVAAISGLSAVNDVDVDPATNILYLISSGGITKVNPDGTEKSGIAAAGVFLTYADVTTPTVTSIARQEPTTADVAHNGTATFRVTFSEPVLNVDPTDFEIVGTMMGTISVNQVSHHKVFDVTIGSFSGPGALELKFSSTHNIVDFRGNVFTGTVGTTEPYNVLTAPVTSTISKESFDAAVYPNPSTGIMTVALSALSAPATAEIYTLTGEKAQSVILDPAEGSSVQVDLRGYAQGMYILRITTSSGTITKKLQKR